MEGHIEPFVLWMVHLGMRSNCWKNAKKYSYYGKYLIFRPR